MTKYHKVLLPTDFSEASEKAIQYALNITKGTNPEVRLIHIVETYPAIAYTGGAVWSNTQFEKQLYENAQEQMDTLLKKLSNPKNVTTKIEVYFGATAARIIHEAQEFGADLIVMSTHGRSGIERFFLGSVTERVIRMTQCPVMVIPKTLN